jgi:hypothetical protein
MMRLTIFSTPKRFAGEFAVLQRNAFLSWTLITPRPEIIIFGDEAGTAETCAELGLVHIPDIGSNEAGTPLVSELFGTAEKLAVGDVLCYVNADIILMDDLFEAISSIARTHDSFLAVGQRCTVPIADPIDFEHRDWAERLRRLARSSGHRDSDYYIDFFAFSKCVFGDLPPFAIGRAAYDNWLIWRALDRKVPVVDVSDAVLAIHQAHGYAHVKGARTEVYEGAEARRNLVLAGGRQHLRSIADASHSMTPAGALVRARGGKYDEARRERRRAKLREHPLVKRSGPVRHALGIRRSVWEALVARWKRR